jgi:hypothetical protein
MKDKKFYYLIGVFRCGNTLLRSIINQNPNFCVTPNSIVPEILYKIFLLKNSDLFLQEKDHVSINSVLKKIINNYYENWKQEHILEQGPWGTPFNYDMLKEIGFLPKKFICLIRPLKEIFASWIKLDNPVLIHHYCDGLMGEYGKIGNSVLSIKNLLEKDKDNLLIINYHKFCDQPEYTIKKIYEFLEIPYFNKHRFVDLDQVDEKSSQTIIRTKNINLNNYNYDELVPKEIMKKYKDIDELFKKYSS